MFEVVRNLTNNCTQNSGKKKGVVGINLLRLLKFGGPSQT